MMVRVIYQNVTIISNALNSLRLLQDQRTDQAKTGSDFEFAQDREQFIRHPACRSIVEGQQAMTGRQIDPITIRQNELHRARIGNDSLATKNTKNTKMESDPVRVFSLIFVAKLILRQLLLSFVVFVIFCLFLFSLRWRDKLPPLEPKTDLSAVALAKAEYR